MTDLSKLSPIDTKFSCVMSKPTKKHNWQSESLDPQYACTIKKATKKTVLKSTTEIVGGQLRWALVPIGHKLVRKMVLILDDPVQFAVIENFSEPTNKNVRPTQTTRTKS